MVSLVNLSLLGFFLFFILVVQAKPSLESSKPSEHNKSLKTNQQLYEIYKSMREDPLLATVSNHDLVLYIYQNFLNGNKNNINSSYQKSPNPQQESE
jgi:hypothetical protein